MKRTVVAAIIFSLSASALPCTVPPKKIIRDHAALVSEATEILVVETVSMPNGNGCNLRIIRALKGNSTTGVPVACRPPESGDWLTSFVAHSESSFWQQRVGRLGINGDCTVIAPAFEVGHKYLLLLGLAPDTKQFEEIDGSKDQWLLFVENQLSRAAR